MSDQDKITAILDAIQSDANLFALLRLMIARNIVNVPSIQLDAMMQALGISQ